MNEAIEYMMKDEKFKQIYEKSVVLQRMSETSETTGDIEALREYAKGLEEQGSQMVIYLVERYSKNSQELANVVDSMFEKYNQLNQVCDQLRRERDDMLSILAEALGTTPGELYKVYIDDTQGEKKPACHLRLIQ